jgi:hypothetical protein
MHELHTAIYQSLLMPGCEMCGIKSACNQAFCIDVKGQVNYYTEHTPDAVVQWPKCPQSYQAGRQAGQDILPLSSIVQWAFERDVHKDPLLGAGGTRLIREWVRCKDHPSKLHEARAAEEHRQKMANR